MSGASEDAGFGDMGLIREMPRIGTWLFRWRSFLPLTVVFGAVIAVLDSPQVHHDSTSALILESVSLGISFLGLLVRGITVGHTPRGTSGRNTKGQIAESLNTTGIYSTVRHPLYLGNFLIGLGLSCFTLIWWFGIIYILAFWLYYERIMLAEEKFLCERFGESYQLWASRTPAFIPSLRHYVPPHLEFSMKNVLRREYNAVLQIAVVAFAFESIGDWVETGQMNFSCPWCIYLGVSLVVWFVLRSLNRRTSLLLVEGR